MSKWFPIIKELHELVVETAVDLKIVNYKPNEYQAASRVVLRRDTRRDGHGRGCWYGGCERIGTLLTPTVTASDHIRYTEKDPWLKYLSTYSFSKSSFKYVSAEARKGNWAHVEYARIMHDPEIGSFNSNDPEHHMLAAMCHEVAHAITHWNKYYDNDVTITTYNRVDWKPHGEFWRETYRALRNELFNPWRQPVQMAAGDDNA